MQGGPYVKVLYMTSTSFCGGLNQPTNLKYYWWRSFQTTPNQPATQFSPKFSVYPRVSWKYPLTFQKITRDSLKSGNQPRKQESLSVPVVSNNICKKKKSNGSKKISNGPMKCQRKAEKFQITQSAEVFTQRGEVFSAGWNNQPTYTSCTGFFSTDPLAGIENRVTILQKIVSRTCLESRSKWDMPSSNGFWCVA